MSDREHAYRPPRNSINGGVYRGRFAPSPTGPLHEGSLLTAVCSYLEAHRHGGQWQVRIDDIDPPREQAGAADAILRALELHGFRWDGPVRYQSRRCDNYQAALDTLRRDGLVFGCGCTRRELVAVARNGPNGLIYPGTCRNGLPPGRRTRAWRVRCGDAWVHFEDAFQGPVEASLAGSVGDFVIRRADGYFAYHLAAAVDDGSDGITDIIRGHDLLWCTPPQQHLQRLLGLHVPRYGHLPLLVDAAGQKLSKQQGARPLDDTRPGIQLWHALRRLRQAPPRDLLAANVDTLWEWAESYWDPAPLRGMTEVSDTLGNR